MHIIYVTCGLEGLVSYLYLYAAVKFLLRTFRIWLAVAIVSVPKLTRYRRDNGRLDITLFSHCTVTTTKKSQFFHGPLSTHNFGKDFFFIASIHTEV